MKKISESAKSLYSYIGLLVVAMIWGLAFTVVKTGLDVVPPTYMIAFRFSIAAIGMLVIFGRKLKTIDKKTLVHGIVVGLFLFIGYEVQTIGCKYTTAGKNAFLTALYIMIVPFIHWMIDKKRPAIRLFISAAIGLVGIGLISLNGDFSINLGDGLTIICGVFFALQIASQDNYLDGGDDPVVICLLEMIVCAVGGWICAPFIDGALPVENLGSLNVWGSMIFLGLISSLLCQLLQSICQKYTKPENASLIMSMESVFGALGSVIFLSEIITGKTLIGCVIMIGAIVLSQVKIKKRN